MKNKIIKQKVPLMIMDHNNKFIARTNSQMATISKTADLLLQCLHKVTNQQ